MRNTLKKFLPLAAVGVISAATTFGTIEYFKKENQNSDFSYFHEANPNVKFAGFNTAALGDDFVKASKITVPAVVTIKNFSNRTPRSSQQDLFEWFFGNPGQQRQPQQAPKDVPSGMGSGVIISPDGYIISNNHVISGANKLEVTLNNKRTYIAELVGTDPNTDIALLKIEESGLPYLNFANSDMVEVGQWVLAVGNPLGLNSTVTAGIVSAKGRSIDLLGQNGKATNPIESFIQTDAAINPGNSGGALVNTNGELIGINSAISSSSGYYQGYGFAVPSNLARKIVEDIKKFGLVQRGFLGVGSLDLSNSMQVRAYNERNKTNLKSGNGIYITEVTSNSGAEDAGLRVGDIITKVDNMNMSAFSDLSVAVGSKRPGDKVTVTYLRNGKENSTLVTLKDQKGNTTFRSKADLTVAEKLGAEFVEIDQRAKVYYGIENGVVVKNVGDGLLSTINVGEGNIIFEINGKPVNSQKDVEKILNNYKGTVSVKYLDDSGRIISRGFTMQ